jgi:hypothetical protein
MHGGTEGKHEDTNVFLLPRLLPLPYCKMDGLRSPNTSMDLYRITWRNNPENRSLHWGRQILKKSLIYTYLYIHSQFWQVSKI